MLQPNEIGGGYVRRTFTIGDRRVKAGDHIEGETLRNMPSANRRALVSAGYVELYPVSSPSGGDERLVKSNEQLRLENQRLTMALNEAIQEIKSLKKAAKR